MKRTKKPVVNKKRKTERNTYEVEFDLEYDLKTVIEKLTEVLSIIESRGEDLAKDPYIEYDYYGYDGGKEINIYYNTYTETEQEWKERVEVEEKALKEWPEDKTNAEIEKLKERIKELEGGTK